MTTCREEEGGNGGSTRGNDKESGQIGLYLVSALATLCSDLYHAEAKMQPAGAAAGCAIKTVSLGYHPTEKDAVDATVDFRHFFKAMGWDQSQSPDGEPNQETSRLWIDMGMPAPGSSLKMLFDYAASVASRIAPAYASSR